LISFGHEELGLRSTCHSMGGGEEQGNFPDDRGLTRATGTVMLCTRSQHVVLAVGVVAVSISTVAVRAI
jgi:hypothetical protein